MQPIRYAKRECRDQDKIDLFLQQAAAGYLGLSVDDMPYVVPLNYVWLNGAVYFHGAAEGRKNDMIARNAQACFTVCESPGTIASPIPAHTDTAYMSVMLFGAVRPVEGLDEAVEAMQAMLDKYVPGYFNQPLAASHLDKYRSSLGSRTVVMKLVPHTITAKENDQPESALFYRGRKAADDARSRSGEG
ncbi:pyridoxamine 5'-phosphate oxidase family protein [Paenibacillus thailandensis]|uniref:Pyridoxamine 5'-phosphate oxidase family protein n=1 Tax=Paenibacillus thailandensis TaxID=393250 RepID=A0ABW5R410_9BACL